MENLPPPNEKELSPSNEKFLRAPTFWEKYGNISKLFALSLILIAILFIALIPLFKSQKPTPTQPAIPASPTITSKSQSKINRIEISPDAKSILNTDTKEVILAIEGTKAYLETSGYAYNPDTFQTTDARYAGDCFLDASLSNKKDRIIFSTSCLPGDLPQPWIGIDKINADSIKQCASNTRCADSTVKFLTPGSGKNFIWSQDDSTITYEADLGLSGQTQPRTIDSNTGQILEKKNSISPSPVDIDQTKNLSNWKTYIDPKEDFSFKYPSDGTVKILKLDKSNADIIYITPSETVFEKNYDFRITIDDNTHNFTTREVVDDYLTKLRNNNSGPGMKETADRISQTIKPYTNGNVTGLIGTYGYETEYLKLTATKNNKIYYFDIHNGNGNTNEYVLKLFDQILSTFKFLDQNQHN